MKFQPPLTDFQRSKLCSVLTLGCTRATACSYVGVSAEQFDAALVGDAEFATAVARAEAEPELRHMGNIFRAAQSEKNWRTSAWWLLQRLRDHAKRGDSGVATVAHLALLVDDLAAAIVAEVPDAAVQRRLIERFRRILAGEAAAENVVATAPLRLAPPVPYTAGPRLYEPTNAEDAR